jgi:hypothetical protein
LEDGIVKAMWMLTRIVRWLLWLTFLAYSLHYVVDKASHVDQFDHLLITTEMMFFGLSLAAMFAGFIELMFRDRAGIVRKPAGGGDAIAR